MNKHIRFLNQEQSHKLCSTQIIDVYMYTKNGIWIPIDYDVPFNKVVGIIKVMRSDGKWEVGRLDRVDEYRLALRITDWNIFIDSSEKVKEMGITGKKAAEAATEFRDGVIMKCRPGEHHFITTARSIDGSTVRDCTKCGYKTSTEPRSKL